MLLHAVRPLESYLHNIDKNLANGSVPHALSERSQTIDSYSRTEY